MIRHYQRGDHEAVAEIFTRAIHEIAAHHYTREQCLAWSDTKPNPAYWQKRCELKRPFIFEQGGRIAAFLELDPDGHIDCAYVHPDFHRQGLMTALVQHAVATCFAMRRPRVYVEASIPARPLFEKCGFTVVRAQMANVKGVELQNYAMERLAPAEAG